MGAVYIELELGRLCPTVDQQRVQDSRKESIQKENIKGARESVQK